MRQKETKGKKQGNTGIRGETVNELSKTKIEAETEREAEKDREKEGRDRLMGRDTSSLISEVQLKRVGIF